MIDFTITPDGGEPHQVTAGSRDIYLWEKTGRDKSFASLMNNITMTDVYAIAHLASRRLGLFSGDLSEFVATVEIGFDQEDEAAGPFHPAPTGGASSPSPSAPASHQASGRRKATKR